MERPPILQGDSKEAPCDLNQVHKKFTGTDEGRLEIETSVLVDRINFEQFNSRRRSFD